MNAYDKYKAGQAKRVRQGKSKMVKVSDLQPGMLICDYGMRFSHNEPVTGPNHCGNIVRFAGGRGFPEKLDTLIEITIES